MSISVGHRAIFTAFGHRNLTPARVHAPSTPAPSPAGEAAVAVEITVPLEAGVLKCSPWEGLYLEQANPFEVNGNEAVPGLTLDTFLTSMMYGE